MTAAAQQAVISPRWPLHWADEYGACRLPLRPQGVACPGRCLTSALRERRHEVPALMIARHGVPAVMNWNIITYACASGSMLHAGWSQRSTPLYAQLCACTHCLGRSSFQRRAAVCPWCCAPQRAATKVRSTALFTTGGKGVQPALRGSWQRCPALPRGPPPPHALGTKPVSVWLLVHPAAALLLTAGHHRCSTPHPFLPSHRGHLLQCWA